jgi:hypothetical protein
LEKHAKIAMRALGKYSKDILLPVNVNKTKIMLFYNAVAPEYPSIFFENMKIEYVSAFKYLGIEIRSKLGWGLSIQNRMCKIRHIYCTFRKIYNNIPRRDIKMKRLLFLTFPLLHFIWIIILWFLFTKQTEDEYRKDAYLRTKINQMKLQLLMKHWHHIGSLLHPQDFVYTIKVWGLERIVSFWKD